jgi:predicted DNA-binding transcriptional regulator AlpA
MENTKKLLSENEFEAVYGIPRGTLARWRFLGKGPRFRKLTGGLGTRGAMVRYAVTDIEEWLRTAPTGGGQQPQAEARAQ